ncbi:DUF2059 domain-containing protein [Kangiella sp. TOML190]|uniref:DUF2059 domain-containing protein n=1 Tax=Kangiella sp. TOML190 TaxID=2931351 RepID=UPI00203ECEED|nr:DUF2059 domain-containing protein [Kangiella sp. TOML190]
MDKYANKFANDPRLVNGIIDLYSNTFNEQELKDLLAFYKTESGKKFVKELPVIMQKSSQLGVEISTSLQQDFGREIQEILK